jgi:hypothetical protein
MPTVNELLSRPVKSYGYVEAARERLRAKGYRQVADEEGTLSWMRPDNPDRADEGGGGPIARRLGRDSDALSGLREAEKFEANLRNIESFREGGTPHNWNPRDPNLPREAYPTYEAFLASQPAGSVEMRNGIPYAKGTTDNTIADVYRGQYFWHMPSSGDVFSMAPIIAGAAFLGAVAAPALFGAAGATGGAAAAGTESALASEALASGAAGVTSSAGPVAFGGAVSGGGLSSAQALSLIESGALAGGATGAGIAAPSVASKGAAPYVSSSASPAGATAAELGETSLQSGFFSGLSTSDAAQLLNAAVSLGAAATVRGVEGSIPSPTAPPREQINRQGERVPTQDELTKRRQRASGDPTALTGPGGVGMGDVLLGRATVLGS